MDGAFFGTTFPHLLLMTYPGMRPQQPPERYVPRVFGFKLNAAALAPSLPDSQRNEASALHPHPARVRLLLAYTGSPALAHGHILLHGRPKHQGEHILFIPQSGSFPARARLPEIGDCEEGQGLQKMEGYV